MAFSKNKTDPRTPSKVKFPDKNIVNRYRANKVMGLNSNTGQNLPKMTGVEIGEDPGNESRGGKFKQVKVSTEDIRQAKSLREEFKRAGG